MTDTHPPAPTSAATDPTEPILVNPAPSELAVTSERGPAEPADTGRSLRTWVWMGGVSLFGLFLVFGSVPAHYWDENAAGTYYVPVEEGMQVLDIWRAQVSGLPDVSNQLALKVLFLGSVFAFLGLAVVALWLATVELWSGPTEGPSSSTGAAPLDSVGARVSKHGSNVG